MITLGDNTVQVIDPVTDSQVEFTYRPHSGMVVIRHGEITPTATDLAELIRALTAIKNHKDNELNRTKRGAQVKKVLNSKYIDQQIESLREMADQGLASGADLEDMQVLLDLREAATASMDDDEYAARWESGEITLIEDNGVEGWLRERETIRNGGNMNTWPFKYIDWKLAAEVYLRHAENHYINERIYWEV